MAFQARHRWMIHKLTESFGIEELEVEDALRRERTLQSINRFFQGEDQPSLLFYYQVL